MTPRKASPSKNVSARSGAVTKTQDPPQEPAAADTTDVGATAEEVGNEAYHWTQGEPPPEPVRYDHAYAERAHVGGKDYYRIVKVSGGSFVYDSEW